MISGETVVLDATFVKAYSRRDPHDNSRGKSDPEARVGRNGKTYELGYKLHIATDVKSEMPIAVIPASANENEKEHAPALFRKAWKATEQQMKTFIADSQYSSRKLREQLSAYGVKAVIPYPANQNRKEADVLRVDKYFRTHGPVEEKQVYTLRGAVERVNSRQKEQSLPRKAQGQRTQMHNYTRIALRDCHAGKCGCSVEAEHAGKSQRSPC